MSTFSDNLTRYREQANMSRKELAAILGVSVASIGFYETGRNEPDLQKLVAIAAALHVSVDDLLGYKVDEYENMAASLQPFGFDLVENDDGTIDILQTENDFTYSICRYRNKADFILDMERAEWRYNKASHNNKALFLDMYFHTDIDEFFFKVVPPRKDAPKKTPPAQDHDDADDEKAKEKGPHSNE